MESKDELRPSIEDCQNVLEQLVRIDTRQPEGNEADLVQWIQNFLPAGVEQVRINHSPNRASLIVKMEGREKTGGAAFIGHLDTVAYSEPKQWKYPPLQAVTEDGILYGRGSADMKGGVAAMLLSMRWIAENKKQLRTPVYFCFTADEEMNGIGVRAVRDSGYLDGIREAVICEPSGERIGTCEKGALWVRIAIHGVASHASRPELGVNAIDHAIWLFESLKKEIDKGDTHEILGRSTVSVTRMNGGIMTNIIPSEVEMELDIRTIPGVSHQGLLNLIEQLKKEMCTIKPELRMEVEVLNDRSALESSRNHPFVEGFLKSAALSDIHTDKKGLCFYTDASQLIPKLEVPFVIAGPGEDEMAHRMNEAISLESVARYTECYCRYVDEHYMG